MCHFKDVKDKVYKNNETINKNIQKIQKINQNFFWVFCYLSIKFHSTGERAKRKRTKNCMKKWLGEGGEGMPKSTWMLVKNESQRRRAHGEERREGRE